MKYWLVKSDPDTYSFQDLYRDKKTSWDGVRNYAARLHLRAMNKGDAVLIYHSGGESCVTGTATVQRDAYPDPTATGNNWVSVELKAGRKLKYPVTLKNMKAEKRLQNIMLLKIGRLSVMPLTRDEYETVMELSEKKPV
ncbi:MAG: EVE domain-containing protein [Bacteroidia bacterium]|nr:EVE domain-containing protein [Bacteroidia bacterium]